LLAQASVRPGENFLGERREPDEIRHSEEPFVKQFVHAELDGPVPFHYPAGDYGEQLGLKALASPRSRP